jgi:autoinducer 2 (AI-2) kinase
MSDALLLAIDAGTGSCRAVVFDPGGRQLAIGQREWSHAPLPGAPGSQVFDTHANWALICECVREALAAPGVDAAAVAAVSSTSMREGMVLYDRGGHEIWACPNVDSRAGEEAVELIESGDARTIYFQGGDWVSITAPARFRWIARHEPDVFAAIAHVGMLSDWILTRLSGEFVTDPSAGSSSGMFELEQRDWSDRVVGLLGLPRDVLPPVLDPGSVVGTVTARAAAETGLRAGTPVVVGGADTQLALVGIGLTEPHRHTVIGGSFWQATVTSDLVRLDPECRLRTLCHTVPGQWMTEGIGFYSGLAMRWFRDGFCDAERAAAAATGADPYALMEALAAQAPPGSGGVVGLFSNVMDAKRWVQTAPGFLGFDIADPAASGKKECIRAIEEAAAYAVRGHYEIVREVAGRPVDEVVFTGGASKGDLWPRILADVLGVPVRVPEVRESTALGAAMYAAVGAELAGDVAELAGAAARFAHTVEPDPAAHRAYTMLYEDWREAYRQSLHMVDAGAIRPLWRPAGA